MGASSNTELPPCPPAPAGDQSSTGPVQLAQFSQNQIEHFQFQQNNLLIWNLFSVTREAITNQSTEMC